MTSTQRVHFPSDSSIGKPNCVINCRSNCCRVVLQAVHDIKWSFQNLTRPSGYVRTWSYGWLWKKPGDQLIIQWKLWSSRQLSKDCVCSSQCNAHSLPRIIIGSWCTRSKFDFLQFCGKSKCESGEITPHIAASIPRHTSSGTTSASSGISETLSTVVRLTAKLTLAYLNLVCLALFGMVFLG